MASNTNQGGRIDPEQREQYEYARKRINRKRWFLRHAVIFVIGLLLLLVVVPFLNLGDDFMLQYWYRWVAIIWFLLFLFHLVNVFVVDRFMGAQWEREQMDKLVAKQQQRIGQMADQLEQDSKKKDTP